MGKQIRTIIKGCDETLATVVHEEKSRKPYLKHALMRASYLRRDHIHILLAQMTKLKWVSVLNVCSSNDLVRSLVFIALNSH